MCPVSGCQNLWSNADRNQINILLLGEIGVGKSTWINALANYLMFATLEEAEENEMVSLIPTSFTMIDENYERKEVKIGHDKDECFTEGESATQHPKTYSFKTNDESKYLRLIDTPGIGDTRGAEQDKINFQNTLRHIAELDVLHGICILLKPNNSRLTVMFNYCIKELMAKLHVDACRNIVFCFTNCRGTFYKPGDTYAPLKKIM